MTRKALDFWYHNRTELKLSVRAFFEQCRLSTDDRTITFVGTFVGTSQGTSPGPAHS